MNQYTPWIEMGMTELEYFKMRYLEMSAENERLREKNGSDVTEPLKAAVDRFLTWPLPSTVCADPCATKPGHEYRSGTNLLTATEAEHMLTHVVGPVFAERDSLRSRVEALEKVAEAAKHAVSAHYENHLAEVMMLVLKGELDALAALDKK